MPRSGSQNPLCCQRYESNNESAKIVELQGDIKTACNARRISSCFVAASEVVCPTKWTCINARHALIIDFPTHLRQHKMLAKKVDPQPMCIDSREIGRSILRDFWSNFVTIQVQS